MNNNNNLLQSYPWDSQYDEPHQQQQQFPRQIPDEVISVYEVYVKEETVGTERQDDPIISGEPGSSGQLMQADCLDFDTAIGSEVINVDGTITKLLGNDAAKYKILEQNVNENNVVVYPHHINDSHPPAPRLVDKDDPRSRLHFVKYLKRDGKTLKIWECGICSKEFRHQYTLMRHLPTHTDERNFKCEACGKAFRQLSTLSQHRAIHSDARPYVCEFCKKTFNRVSTLISHRKTHSEHKPHKCHLCGKGFHQKGNLRNHVFTHTNERPYKCETCGKGFNQMSNLMCHKIKTHAHAEKMQYVCGICGKEFPRRFSLRSHEEYKHGIKYRQPNAPPAVLQNANDPGLARNKHLSIDPLPNGEQRPLINDTEDKENLNPGGFYPGGVIIDKIETKAMENAILEGQTPFALFKPVKGIPVLVKVGSTTNRKQVMKELSHYSPLVRNMLLRRSWLILTPATAEDLRMAGKMTLSPPPTDLDGVKAVQIKVPVVATVTQRLEPDGNYSFIIEPPGPGQEQESLIEPIESDFNCLDQRDNLQLRCDSGVEKNSQEDCNDLLELAAQGGIQFVRATEDGRYEVMTNSEARDLMAQNSHDVTILDGEDAEAISVVNIQNQENQFTGNNGSKQEIMIGESSSEITVLNSGNNSQNSRATAIIDGIEILDEKDVRILGEKCSLDSDQHLVNGGSAIFDQNKIYDYNINGKEFFNVTNNQQIISTTQDNFQQLQNSVNKISTVNHRHHHHFSLQNNNQSGSESPIFNHNFHGIKQSDSFNDHNVPTIISCNDNTIGKNQLNDFSSKFRQLSNFDNPGNSNGNRYCGEQLSSGFNTEMIKTEVKILGPKNQNKIKILGQDNKVLEFGNSGCGEKVKILGAVKSQDPEVKKEDYKDVKILGECSSYDQFSGHQLAVQSSADHRLIHKKDVKILGKKKDSSRYTVTTGGFEVTSSTETVPRCVPKTIVIQDSPPSPNYKSADFIQLARCGNPGDEIDIDLLENSVSIIRDVEMQANALNDIQEMSVPNEIEKDDKITEVPSISEKDFEMIGNCQAIIYDSLPDLD